MSHKLEINIEDLEGGHQEGNEEGSEEEEENSERERGENYQEEQQQEDENNRSQQYHSYGMGDSNLQGLQSVQTFGNHQFCQGKQFDLLKGKYSFGKQLQKQKKISCLLSQTPIQSNDSSLKKQSVSNVGDSSNLQDQINRIVAKVLAKDKPLGQSGYKKQMERINKIDRVNRELLNENAHLISQINQLENNLGSLSRRAKKKEENRQGNRSGFEDKNLMKQLKCLKQKLAKALNLNSKLQSRLLTEKNKSQMISNTQRSILNKLQVNAEDINIQSTIKSQCSGIGRKDKRQQQRQGGKAVYCEKCCKELKSMNSGLSMSNRPVIFSPVLQVKDYQINNSKSCKISVFEPSIKVSLKNASCQAELDRDESQEQLLLLQRQEKQLQLQISRNNTIISEYEDSLLKMIEFE